MQQFCLTAAGNLYVSFERSPLTLYKRPLATLWQSDMFDHSSISSNPDFPPIDTKAMGRIYVDHIQNWAIAVYKLPSLTKEKNVPITTQPVKVKIIVWFFRNGISHRETIFVKPAVIPRGCMGISWRLIHRKKAVFYFVSWRELKAFSQRPGMWPTDSWLPPPVTHIGTPSPEL